MANCPECNSELDHLILSETRTHDFKATYHAETEDFDYFDTEEWRGNPTGEVEKQEFKCPYCNATLFTSEEDAKAFYQKDIDDKLAEEEGRSLVRPQRRF